MDPTMIRATRIPTTEYKSPLKIASSESPINRSTSSLKTRA